MQINTLQLQIIIVSDSSTNATYALLLYDVVNIDNQADVLIGFNAAGSLLWK